MVVHRVVELQTKRGELKYYADIAFRVDAVEGSADVVVSLLQAGPVDHVAVVEFELLREEQDVLRPEEALSRGDVRRQVQQHFLLVY